MNTPELNELSKLAREDGKRLFEVANTLNNLGLVGIGVLALIGVLAAFGAGSNAGVGAGILVMALVAIICWFLYLGLVLTTSMSKVFVHILFSSLATAEEQNKNNLTT